MPPASGEDPAAAVGRGRGPRRVLFWILLPYLLHVALRLLLSANLDCPLKPDELVYLGNARYLATGSGLVDPTGRSPYKVGYSLLLIPAFLYDSDSVGGFKAVQVTNAFLLSLVYPAAFLLAGALCRGLGRFDRLLVASCVSLYPAATLYSTTAMSANAFLPAFLWLAVAGLSALSTPRGWSWGLLGAAAAYLYTVHERGLAVVGVTVVTAALFLLSRVPHRTRSLALFATMPLTLGLVRLAEVPGSRYRTGSTGLKVLRQALADPEALAVTLSGQLWYLGLATGGILFAGSLLLLLRRGKLGDESVPRLFWLLIYGSAAGNFGLSVLFMSQRTDARFTHWIYGRYNEGLLLPLLLVAVLALKDADRRRRKLFLGGSIATLALTGGLTLILNQAWTPKIGPPFSFSATSSPIYAELLGWGILRSGATFAVVFAVLAALFFYRWRWGVLGLGLFFAASTAVTYRNTWVERYELVDGQRDLARLVRRIEPERPVILYDAVARPFYFHYYNLSYHLPEVAFRRFRPRRSGDPEGDMVLSRRPDFGWHHPAARLAGLENLRRVWTPQIHGLWVLPGPLQDRLAGRGWLLPAGFPAALEAEDLSAELEILAPLRRRLRRGQGVPIRLRVTHRGGVPWPHRDGLKAREYSVRLAVEWLAGGEPAARQWIDLPRFLYPGDSVTLDFELAAGESLPAGGYRLAIAVAQQGEEEPVRRGEGLEVEVEVE